MTATMELKQVESPVLVLVGPTAIGKTSLAIALARRFDCEIVSVDSMQVYRYMDIGTAKPDLCEQGGIAHHLIDIADPDEDYDAGRFASDAMTVVRDILSRGKIPLLTGGTGLYLKALLYGLCLSGDRKDQDRMRRDLNLRLQQEGRAALFAELRKCDPATADRLHPNDTRRLVRALEIFVLTGTPWSTHIAQQGMKKPRFSRLLQIGLRCDRGMLYERIEKRTVSMMEKGLVAEVEALRKKGYDPLLKSMQSIGYRHVNNLLDGTWNQAETVEYLVRDTRRYAKRQLTWFSRHPGLIWHDPADSDAVFQETDSWLHGSALRTETR